MKKIIKIIIKFKLINKNLIKIKYKLRKLFQIRINKKIYKRFNNKILDKINYQLKIIRIIFNKKIFKINSH
jgi:hypothetical protein